MSLVLSIDPSGNFKNGKGKTGIVLAQLHEGGYTIKLIETIAAKDFDTHLEYWKSHLVIIDPSLKHLVVENYMLYPGSFQTFSYLETPRLLGAIEMDAHDKNVPLTFQMAKDTTGYSDDILLEKGILTKHKNRYYYLGEIPVNDHERSALRHFLRWYDTEGKNEPI
jgi:hypothetical protein